VKNFVCCRYRRDFLAPPQLPPEEEEEPAPPPQKKPDIKPSTTKQYGNQGVSSVSKSEEKRPKTTKKRNKSKTPKVS